MRWLDTNLVASELLNFTIISSRDSKRCYLADSEVGSVKDQTKILFSYRICSATRAAQSIKLKFECACFFEIALVLNIVH